MRFKVNPLDGQLVPDSDEGTNVSITQSGSSSSGVSSISESGQPQLTGDVTLSEGAGISLTQTGNDIQIASTGGSGSGDVVGPASATDNAIVRYDGTTGKIIQNSTVTVSDTGDIATSGTVDGRDVSVDGARLDVITDANYLNANTTKAQVGLGNVDNTSDLNKPISTATQTALDTKVDENAAITGATKTKITYDAKGLVTAGADATTADIADSTNRRYVTDADLVDIGNLSGVNTGDQTTIVGITGTTAQFNTALTDNDLATLAGSETLTNKTLTTPTIASFANANHNHTNAAGGGQLSITGATTGTLTVARGGTGATTLTSGNVLVGAGTSAVTTTKSAPTGDFVGTTDTQTLTNKTLTTPIISTISNTGTLTLPTSTDTLVGRATSDTLTNKAISAAANAIAGTDNGNLATATGALGGTWQSYTPTLSGRFNNSKWTKNCFYMQVGKTVIVKIGLTANAATPMDGGTADCFITLPVTARTLTQTGNIQVMGMFNGFISGLHIGNFSLASTTTAILRTQAVSGSNIVQQQITSTVPATWASGNEIGGTFVYEAA